MLKLLIDECLTPGLVSIARIRGFLLSRHVNDVGLLATPDPTIFRFAVEEGYVLVTNNRKDYLPLVRNEPAHPGLICLLGTFPRMDARAQKDLLGEALDNLGGQDPSNCVIEATLFCGGRIDVVCYPLALPNLTR